VKVLLSSCRKSKVYFALASQFLYANSPKAVKNVENCFIITR